MPEKQPTKKQHYVPQIYLKGFSRDSATIYEYNFAKREAIKKPVCIESVCREQFLYEIRDQSGEIINTNFIEDILCEYEGQFAEYRRKLLRKSVVKANYNTLCFLSKEEKIFWIFYTALQIMRSPSMLNGIGSILREELQGQLSQEEAHNVAVAFCLPFFKKPRSGEMTALTYFISLLITKILTVGYAESDNLFTSEHTMYGVRNSAEGLFTFKKLWFPISSNCVLLFSEPGESVRIKKNCLIPITEEDVHEINKGIAYIARKMVFSKHPFSESDIQLIEDARRERAEDEKVLSDRQ